jgi:hypothetical protein
MWCAICHQDVPARRDAGNSARVCSRCGGTLPSADQPGEPCDGIETSSFESIDAPFPDDSTCPDTIPLGSHRTASDFDNLALERLLAGPPLPSEDWEFEAELRDVNRLMHRLRSSPAPRPADTTNSHRDAFPLSSVAIPSAMLRMQSSGAAADRRIEPRGEPEKSNLAAWALLSLGLATFVCGGVLVGWSFWADRADLWSLGLPLTLAGQAGLIVGLVLQLEGLWRSNRQTDQTLSDLDGQLSQLRQATTLLSTTHSTPGQSFYAHMAEGAGPELLLADLKGQLDLLAQQMAHQRRRSA